MSSQAGFVALPGESIYCMTKAAISHLTKCLAVEWGRYNITVNAVAPTFIRTPGTESYLTNPDNRAEVRFLAREPPGLKYPLIWNSRVCPPRKRISTYFHDSFILKGNPARRTAPQKFRRSKKNFPAKISSRLLSDIYNFLGIPASEPEPWFIIGYISLLHP